MNLPERATLKDVLQHYQDQSPPLSAIAPSLAISINQEYATLESPLHAGDEVAFLPPVSGGITQITSAVKGRFSVITHEIISGQELLDRIKKPEDGAAVVFEGVVRNNTRGRRTLFLDYEAYEEMAVKQMDDLAEKALSQFSVREIAIVHRLGRLQIGETSVAIAVASAHRAAAFEACRWLIDTLKRTVPIWKKEHFEDGAVWADGEPFPAEIASARGSHPSEPASK